LKEQEDIMRRSAIDLLEDDFDDGLAAVTPWELGLTKDLADDDDDDDDDDLGIRALFEHPEAILSAPRWTNAA
jgi:hypothetical protein